MLKFLASILAGDVDVLAQEIVGERIMAYESRRFTHFDVINESDRAELYEEILNVPLQLELNSEPPLFLSKDKSVYEIIIRPMGVLVIGARLIAPQMPIYFREVVSADVYYRVVLYKEAMKMFTHGINFQQIAVNLENIATDPQSIVEAIHKISKMQRTAIDRVVEKYIPYFM